MPVNIFRKKKLIVLKNQVNDGWLNPIKYILRLFYYCKESACNLGDPDSDPGLGKFPGEEIGSPFQYSWTFQVA